MSKLLGDDLLEGADAIAEFLFGNKNKRRRVYYLTDQLPIFRLGTSICARKSSLLAMIEELEAPKGSPTANNLAEAGK
jgi:hypothetical protein